MARVFKWVTLVMVGLVLCVAAVWLVSRALGPSKTEREALALIDAPAPRGERDGFAALYTVSRDVPEAEQAAVLAEDVRRFSAALPARDGMSQPWQSTLEAWPELGENHPDDPLWCPLRESGCLEHVRARPEAYAGLLERNAAVLDRAVALVAWDHFHSPFPSRFDTPLPAYQSLTRLTTRDAWRFAHGDVDAGLTGVCTGVSLGRTLIAAGDSLIGSMVGAAMVQGNAMLLAEMLAELPRDHALPESCTAAFTLPFPLQEGVCRAMLAEGRYATGALRSQITASVAAESSDRRIPAWSAGLLFNPEHTAARGAPKFAWYCGDQAREQMLGDLPLHDPAPAPSPWSLACVSNAVGCILMDIAAPAYVDYGQRLQDADARLRTTAALLWLRGHDGVIDQAVLAQLPGSLQSPSRPLVLDTDTGALVTALHEPQHHGQGGHDGTWSLPLPASRLQADADGS